MANAERFEACPSWKAVFRAPDANNTPPGCPELRRLQRLNRRGFLQAGMLGAAGLSLPELLTVPEKGKE